MFADPFHYAAHRPKVLREVRLWYGSGKGELGGSGSKYLLSRVISTGNGSQGQEPKLVYL